MKHNLAGCPTLAFLDLGQPVQDDLGHSERPNPLWGQLGTESHPSSGIHPLQVINLVLLQLYLLVVGPFLCIVGQGEYGPLPLGAPAPTVHSVEKQIVGLWPLPIPLGGSPSQDEWAG